MADKIEFVASFPAIQSAIMISGYGDGMRIKLDIPESSFIGALQALRMRQQPFKVTFEPLDVVEEQVKSENGTIVRRKAKQRKQ